MNEGTLAEPHHARKKRTKREKFTCENHWTVVQPLAEEDDSEHTGHQWVHHRQTGLRRCKRAGLECVRGEKKATTPVSSRT